MHVVLSGARVQTRPWEGENKNDGGHLSRKTSFAGQLPPKTFVNTADGGIEENSGIEFTPKKPGARQTAGHTLVATTSGTGCRRISTRCLEQREAVEDVNLSHLTGRISAVGRRE